VLHAQLLCLGEGYGNRFESSVQTRYYFSSYHLWGAAHFARLTFEQESGPDPNFNIQHRTYVINAILAAVTFLECAVNELFDDLTDEHLLYIDPLCEDAKRSLIELWTNNKKFERSGTLQKYRETLRWVGKPAFDENSPPYEDAALIIKLRNELMHAHSRTRESGDTTALHVALSKKFRPNRHMADKGNPYFPDQCLSAACAEWAVGSATAFANEFFSRLEMQPDYQRVNFGPADCEKPRGV
jgi:hypothetical protein